MSNDIIVNIDAALMNVQKGDALVLFAPEDTSDKRIDRVVERIQEVFVVNDIDMSVIVLPDTWLGFVTQGEDTEKYKEVKKKYDSDRL